MRNVSDNAYHNLANVKAGKGDPCRLVGMTKAQIAAMTTDAQLYALEESLKSTVGGWRLPDAEDSHAFAGDPNYATWSDHASTNLGYKTNRYWANPGKVVDSDTRLVGAYSPFVGDASDVTAPTVGKDVDFLPAAGCRNVGGGMQHLNEYGLYWLSTPHSGSNAYFLEVYTNSLYPSRAYSSSRSFAVRCVRPE